MCRIFKKALFHSTVVVFISTVFQAQLHEAVSLSHSGKFEDAEKLFDKLDSSSLELKIARGYNYSWWGNYQDAKETFSTLINQYPENLEAKIGLAYTNLYQGNFKEAMMSFKRLRNQAKGNRSILVGLILSYLEKNQFGLARVHCKELQFFFSNDEESFFLSGLIYLKNKKYQLAKTEFLKVLAINPSHQAANEQLQEIPKTRKQWEIAPMLGYSNLGQSNQFGLKRIDLFFSKSQKDLFYGYYDNSIRFENQFFLLNHVNSPQIGLGYHHSWDKKQESSLQIGQRLNSRELQETFFRYEHHLILPKFWKVKAGLQFNKIQIQSNGVLSVQAEKKLSKSFSLEFGYFYSSQFNEAIQTDRILVIPKFRLKKGTELDLGFYSFLLKSPEGKSRVYEGTFLTLNHPFNPQLNGRLFLHHQSQEQFNVMSVGLGSSLKF